MRLRMTCKLLNYLIDEAILLCASIDLSGCNVNWSKFLNLENSNRNLSHLNEGELEFELEEKTNIVAEVPVRFALPNLKKLCLKIIFAEIFIQVLELVPKIETLNIKDSVPFITSFEAPDLQKMCTTSTLKYLKIEKGMLIGGMCQLISTQKSLRYLNLGRAWNSLDNDSIQKLAQSMDKLESVYFTDASHFSVSMFALYCTNLSEISAHECKGVGDLTLVFLAENCKALKELHVTKCVGVTDNGITSLCSSSSKVIKTLEILNLSDCTKLTNISLGVIKRLKKLKRLNLKGISRLTDAGLINLSNGLSDLFEEIDLSFCYTLSALSIDSLIEKCEKLSKINLRGCPSFTEYQLNLFQEKLKRSRSKVSTVGLEQLKPFKKKIKKKIKRSDIMDVNDLQNMLDDTTVESPKEIKNRERLLRKKKQQRKANRKPSNS